MRKRRRLLWTVRNHLHKRAVRRSDRLTFDEQEVIAQPWATELASAAAPGRQATSSRWSDGRELSCPTTTATRGRSSRARRDPRSGPRRPSVTGRSSRSRSRTRHLDRSTGRFGCGAQARLSDRSGARAAPLHATPCRGTSRVLPFAREQRDARGERPGFCRGASRQSGGAPRCSSGLLCTVRRPRRSRTDRCWPSSTTSACCRDDPGVRRRWSGVSPRPYHVYTGSSALGGGGRPSARARSAAILPRSTLSPCRLAAEVTRTEVLFFATLLHARGQSVRGQGSFAARRRNGAGHPRALRPVSRRYVADPPSDPAPPESCISWRRAETCPSRTRSSSSCGKCAIARGCATSYPFTIADISTTGPTSMTAWKSRCSTSCSRPLTLALEGRQQPDLGRLARIRAQVARRWNPAIRSRLFLDEFLKSMPERYLLSNTPAEIAAHALVAYRGRDSPVSAALVPSRHPEVDINAPVVAPGAVAYCLVPGNK